MSGTDLFEYYINGNWVLDPHSPTERDPAGYENNIITIEELRKLPLVGTDSTPSAMAKQQEPDEPSPPEATAAAERPAEPAKGEPVPEVAAEAETTTSVTDKVTGKFLEITAPVTAAAAAAGAAVVGFIHTSDEGGDENRLIPGTFPETPQAEETERVATSTEHDAPAKGENANLETKELETGAAATEGDGFAAALAADKEANTAPVASPDETPSAPVAPAKNDEFGILPVPSATAPEGTKPLAPSTFKQPEENDFTAALAADKEANTAPVTSPDESPSAPVAPAKNDEFGILPVPSATAPEGTKPLVPSTFKQPEENDFAAALAADKEANTARVASPPSAPAAPAKNDEFGILPVPSATAPEGTKPLAPSTFKQPEENDFAAALAADKEVNTAPIASPNESPSAPAAPAKNDEFGILPVPSATAPEGTKPLAPSTFKQPEENDFATALAADKETNTAPVGSASEIAAAPEKNDTLGILPVPSPTAPEGTKPLAKSTYAVVSTDGPSHEPVADDSNVLDTSTTEKDKTEILKNAALNSSHHAADTAAKAVAEDAPTPSPLNAEETLAGLAAGAGVTAVGTATLTESEQTGLSRLVVRKAEDDEVQVESDAKAAQVEPSIVIDDTKMAKTTVETLGPSEAAAVASTPVATSVPTDDGVQEVKGLGTAIVTDGEMSGAALKEELSASGKALPEGALAHLSEEKEHKKEENVPPSTPSKEETSTPVKTPASVSSAAKKDKRLSGVPSEVGSEKKRKGGFLKKLKKIFS